MTWGKRMFDLWGAGVLLIACAPVLLLLICLVLVRDGRPVFHRSRRMQTPGHSFYMWKIRTMTPSDDADGITGGHAKARITTTGKWMRQWRLDELPQLWNVMCGEMSLVGPRPPLPRIVAAFPTLYARVLRSRPGITGAGTLRLLGDEARVLAVCQTAAQTEATYARVCIHKKARVDLAYHRSWSLWRDLTVLGQTAIAFFCGFQGRGLLPLTGRRVRLRIWIKHCFHLVTASARARLRHR